MSHLLNLDSFSGIKQSPNYRPARSPFAVAVIVSLLHPAPLPLERVPGVGP